MDVQPQDLKYSLFIHEIISSWNPQPEWYRCKKTWESIQVPEGYEKPPKGEFEAKLQELIDVQPLNELRKERNRRLAEVDWIFGGDYQLSEEEWGVWTTYRQALRDLPSTTEDPSNPVWPEKPPLPSGKTREMNLHEELESEKSKVILLQNVVYSLIKRVEELENA